MTCTSFDCYCAPSDKRVRCSSRGTHWVSLSWHQRARTIAMQMPLGNRPVWASMSRACGSTSFYTELSVSCTAVGRNERGATSISFNALEPIRKTKGVKRFQRGVGGGPHEQQKNTQNTDVYLPRYPGTRCHLVVSLAESTVLSRSG